MKSQRVAIEIVHQKEVIYQYQINLLVIIPNPPHQNVKSIMKKKRKLKFTPSKHLSL
jgi:hypothetical protein